MKWNTQCLVGGIRQQSIERRDHPSSCFQEKQVKNKTDEQKRLVFVHLFYLKKLLVSPFPKIIKDNFSK